MADVEKLYDSLVCRLCGEENRNGSHIYQNEEAADDLGAVINKYLPLKVRDDGKFPCTLCPGCTIQLEATRSFFDLIVDGQKKLQQLYDLQLEAERDALETALKIANPNASVQTYTVHADESGDKIFIQILSDGPLFPADHEMSITLDADSNEKPKKKRGRPPKPPIDPNAILETTDNEQAVPVELEAEPEEELDSNEKRKRRIKKPLKYSDLIDGKDLERVFREEGINDDEDNRPPSKSAVLSVQEMQPKPLLKTPPPSRSKAHALNKKSVGKKKYDCEICGRTFLHQSRLDLHKSCHKDIFYQCVTCTASFTCKEDFDEHSTTFSDHQEFKLIEFVENYGQIELPNSIEKDLTVMKSTEINETENQQEQSEKHKCEFCEKLFTSKQNLQVHQKAVHANEKPYTCDKCNKHFPYLYSYKNHMLQHNEKTYPCDQCPKIFHHPSSVVYHREAEHNNGRKFVCNKCKKSFKHKQLLLRHQLVHTAERPFACNYVQCTAAFKTRANLLNHMATHNKEKKYFCTECGLCFPYKTSLNLHHRWHNGQKPHVCDVCDKRFSQKGNLAEHRRIHTGEKPFCCAHCGRRFTTSSQYKLHVKRHTGERPWKCEYCAKSFLHKDTWKNHTRRHRNERPFQCSYCLRGFTEQWAVKKHERLHTGEKPYTCDICSKTFADSSNLKKHKKIHFKHQQQQQLQETSKAFDQVLYVTYQNPEGVADPQREALVHLVDQTADDALFADDLLQSTPGEEISVDVQQLVDNDGNAISFTTEDGQQINVVTTMDDEQCIQGLLPDGTLVPINLSTSQDGKPVAELLPPLNTTNANEDLLPLPEDGAQNLCFIASYDANQFININ